MAQTMTVTASSFGGPGDPGTGSQGYRGDNLNQHPDSFAELSNNPGAQDYSALGNLPHGTQVTVTNPANGKSLTLYKRDVGAGGAGINGTKRGIDLWYKAAQQLGINGLGVVKVTIGGGGAPGNVKAAAQQRAGVSPTSTTTTTGGQTDYGSAIRDALMASATAPIVGANGKATSLGSNDLLNRISQNVASGNYLTPVTKTVNSAGAPASSPSAGPKVRIGSFSGYVNPIHGATIGRTDMGLDASGLPDGHPIVAPGDSKVIGISPNWYRGQPYVLFQFTNGPKAGKEYYISEAIRPTVKPGDVVHAGQQVGTFTTSGTGLELGWGSPVPGRTLAQATTGYHEGQVTPAGVDFARFFHSLR